jgi:hypothetical protein
VRTWPIDPLGLRNNQAEVSMIGRADVEGSKSMCTEKQHLKSQRTEKHIKTQTNKQTHKQLF